MPHAEPVAPAVNGSASPSGEHKKLILCFDGTGNTFSGTNADTNVAKILRKLDRNHTEQFHYYQTGIGTYDVSETSIHKSFLGEARSKFSKAIDQGFGTTFDAHIMAGYRFLMRYYEPDAKIYIFGFSRGAFTAKYLARMINVVGLLCKGNEEMVPFAYRLYARSLELQSADRVAAQKADQKVTGKKRRTFSGSNTNHNDFDDGESSDETEALLGESSGSQTPPTLVTSQADGSEPATPQPESILAGGVEVKESPETTEALAEIKAFGETFCRSAGNSLMKDHENIQVFFLGLWDCVNSVAVVEKHAPAPVEVAGTAKYIRHAVAVDERRVKFKPALFAQDIRNEFHKDEDCHKNGEVRDDSHKSNIREVWFPGNHGDVGGGWPAFDRKPPSEMGYLEWFGSIWTSMKPKKYKKREVLDDNRLQMSDMALEWMIREIDLVGKKEPKARVHWSPAYDQFKLLMRDQKSVAANITKGFMHDCLSFGYGTSCFKVLMWKFMEILPFMPRWELNDYENQDERGWESYRGLPNFSAYRDIPRGAVLHESLRQRLVENTKYLPKNNHGARSPKDSSGEPCLIKSDGKPVDMYEVPRRAGKPEEWDVRHKVYTLKKTN